MTLEEKIIETLTAEGWSLGEASTEAFNYTTAWLKGEVDPETISKVSGIPKAELIQQARERRNNRKNKRRKSAWTL